MFLKKVKNHLSREIFFVVLLGFVIRLFACQYTFIVNPDGILYINQAKAMYYGQWENLTSCGLSYLSNYSILIAGAYTIFHNWIIAARSVSFLFGFATLIPLYFLLKRFFDKQVSALGTLIFALVPVLVGRSADVVRGPLCWFFLVLGLSLFISQINKKNHLYLLFSSLSFLMATWARIEAILFFIVSGFYILAVRQEKKIEKLAIFFAPVVIVTMFCISETIIFGVSVNDFHRANEILDKFSGPIVQYRKLETSLTELIIHQRDGILKFFLPEARNCVWLIALGTILNRSLEAFFYPFFLVFAIGLGGIWGRIKKDRRVLYFSLLAISGLVLLYLHTLQRWMIYYRFMAIVIFPCAIFVGFGLEKIIRFLRSRFGLRQSAALSIVSLLILVSALPKNLQPRGADKLVFRQIGELIAEREGNDQAVVVASSSQIPKWVSFYANLNYKGESCGQLYDNSWGKITNDYGQFVRHLRQRGVRYFLWEETHWPQEKFDFINRLDPKDFTEVGCWHHPSIGRMILFKVI